MQAKFLYSVRTCHVLSKCHLWSTIKVMTLKAVRYLGDHLPPSTTISSSWAEALRQLFSLSASWWQQLLLEGRSLDSYSSTLSPAVTSPRPSTVFCWWQWVVTYQLGLHSHSFSHYLLRRCDGKNIWILYSAILLCHWGNKLCNSN